MKTQLSEILENCWKKFLPEEQEEFVWHVYKDPKLKELFKMEGNHLGWGNWIFTFYFFEKKIEYHIYASDL